MKVNIKGLVFTGFAAAILSANAMAANPALPINTVTSKSYVDAKISSAENISSTSTTTAPNEKQVYDALATKQDKDGTGVYKVGRQGAWQPAYNAVAVDTTYLTKTDNSETGVATVAIDTTKMTTTGVDSNTGQMSLDNTSSRLVSEKAVAEAVAAAANVENFVVNNLDSNATNKAPSQNAVNSALSGKQNITAADSKFVVGNSGGTWQSVSSAVLDGTYTTQAVNASTGAVTIDVDATTNSALTESDKIPTAGTVKDYVDSEIAAVNSARTYNADSTTISLDATTNTFSATTGGVEATNSGLVTGATVKSYVDAKVVDNVTDTSTDIAPSVGAVNSALATKENVSNKTQTIDSNSNSAQYPSAEAVYDYVQSVTGGTTIPARNELVCTDSTPCALVYEADGAHWRTMATATDSGGVLGDAPANNG